MLLQQQLEMIKSLVEEYELSMDVALILLSQSLVNPMTKVTQKDEIHY